MELLQGAFIYLVAMVVAVPLAKRLGLGSVLGYLLAGIVIGPALGIVGAETKDVKHFAEFGVVMMLFLIGLELQPAMLWRMRSRLLGLGGLQVAVTTAAIYSVALAGGLAWQSALAIAMTLALSSTAIVLQTLEEKGWMKRSAGQSAFSVLLFQDIAVIPMIALLPLLAIQGAGHGEANANHGGGLDHLPGWLQGLVILGVIAAIVLAGRYLMRPVFRFIAQARLREIFSAAALVLVVGIALAMDRIGLSPALGTFLAGVVLSGSEFRHELESDIAPFKGLLLGVFFISVGAGIDFHLLLGQPGCILGLAVGLMALKLLVLFVLGRSFGLRGAALWLFSLGLAQAGEFAFVLFGFAGGAGVLVAETTELLTLVVAITMLLTPLAFIVYERIVEPRFGRRDQRRGRRDRRAGNGDHRRCRPVRSDRQPDAHHQRPRDGGARPRRRHDRACSTFWRPVLLRRRHPPRSAPLRGRRERDVAGRGPRRPREAEPARGARLPPPPPVPHHSASPRPAARL